VTTSSFPSGESSGVRIAVNDEFSPWTLSSASCDCLNPRGRAAILTFHSGEDRRVKKAFEAACGRSIFRISR